MSKYTAKALQNHATIAWFSLYKKTGTLGVRSFLLDYFCLSMRFSLFLISIIRLPEYRR